MVVEQSLLLSRTVRLSPETVKPTGAQHESQDQDHDRHGSVEWDRIRSCQGVARRTRVIMTLTLKESRTFR